MSDINWRPYAAFGLFGSVLLILFSYILWGEAVRLTEQRISDEDRAEAHIEYAQDRIEKNCLALDVMPLRDCFQQEIEAAKDHSRAEGDLDAQKAMARFTRVMAYTGIGGLVLGLASIALIFSTLWETRAGILIMRNEQRPWLAISIDAEAELQLIAGDRYFLSLKSDIKNHGKTVADRIRYFFDVSYTVFEGKKHEGEFIHTADARDVIFPDQATPGPFAVADTLADIPTAPHSITIRIKIEYRSPGMSDIAQPFETIASREIRTMSGANIVYPDDFLNAEGDATAIKVFLSNEYGHQSKVK